jgi:putative membrane protein
MDLARGRKAFERDANARSERGWRIMNEVPTVALILIVVLVIAKPF